MVGNMTGMKSELGFTTRAVSENVKKHRERNGYGYARLSRELTKLGRDIPSLGLSRIESGDRRVDVDDLMALALVFGVSPIRLLMPDAPDKDDTVRLTGATTNASRAWSWLNGSYPLGGSVLAFYEHALPAWERDSLEEKLGATRDSP